MESTGVYVQGGKALEHIAWEVFAAVTKISNHAFRASRARFQFWQVWNTLKNFFSSVIQFNQEYCLSGNG